MRVTILNQFYRPELAPTAHLAASLADSLADAGFEVRVVASRGGYAAPHDGPADADDGNPRIHRLWTPRLGKKNLLLRLTDYSAFYFAALWRMVRLPRQDVVVTLTTPPLIGLTAAAHRVFHPSARIILWNMDCYPDIAEKAGLVRRGGLASNLWQSVTRVLFRQLAHVVTLDTAMTDLLRTRYAPKGRELPMTVVPNWEPLEMFPEQPERPVTKADRSFTLLYLGNAGVGHRFETVLDAAEMLRGEPIRFLFIGGGARYEEITAEVDRRGLDNVQMQGYVPKEQTPDVLANADAALITLSDDSKGVMSPSKLHSNLAMGLPIVYVGPERSNVDDAIAAFGCGVSLRHGQAAELVDYLRRLERDADLQAEARRKARGAFEARYCDRVTLPAFHAVIKQVTAGEPEPEPATAG